MKRASILIFASIILAVGSIYWNNKSKRQFKQELIDNIDNYEDAKRILLMNKDSIQKNLDLIDSDSTAIFNKSEVFKGNKYFFVNTVLKSNSRIPELRQLLTLWDEGLIKDETDGFLWFNKDNTIVFKARTYNGNLFTPSISHYIVFDPNHNFADENNIFPYEIIDTKQLNNDWIYLIQKRHFDY